jgi:hypothetical protein
MMMLPTAGMAWVLLPGLAEAGTAGDTPARPLVDDATDRPAPPSAACALEGARCGRIEGRELVVTEGGQQVVVELPPGADRLALSDHGWAAFVAPSGPWPAVHVVSPAGLVWPVTNEELPLTPGRRPEGFVAPPVREGDLRFDRDGLVWTLPDGERVHVVVPELRGPTL